LLSGLNLPLPHYFESLAAEPSRTERFSPAGKLCNEEGTMRATRIAIALAAPLACGIAAPQGASAQDYRGTLEQQFACTPDVLRLCGEQIPDTNRIVACLRQNTPQLSDGCRAVFESNASVPQQASPQQASPQQPSPVRRGDLQRRSDGRY
jgi:hypothetical protein